MSKQNKAVIAIACTSGCSLIVWMICAVLYVTGGQDVATASASRPTSTATGTQPDAIAARTDTALASGETSSPDSSPTQPKSLLHPAEKKSVGGAAASDRQPAIVPAENKLAGRFPFSVFEKPITAITVDPSHQRILLIGIQENSLSMIRIGHIGQQHPQIQSIKVDGTPVAVALKKWQDHTLYVVATTSPARLVLIDSDSLEVVRRVQLNAFQPQRLWDHQDESSPLIVVGKNPEKFEFEFDPRRGFVRGMSNAVEFDIESMAVTRKSHGAIWDVSPNGKCLFTLERSPMNFGPFPHQTKTSAIIADSIASAPLANQFPALLDDMVVIGRTLLKAQDLNEKIGVMEFDVLSSMSGTTLLAGTIGQTFRVGTRNDMETLFDIDLPEEWKINPRHRKSYEPPPAFVVADPVSETFVLASADRIATFPLSEMGIEATPDLSLSARFPIAHVGELLSVPLSGRSELKTLQLEQAPEGMTLQSAETRWTPTIEQVGTHQVAIRHTAGDESAVSKFVIIVERSGLELSFEVMSILDSPTDGPSLVAGRRLNAERKWESMVASVDLETKQILASRQTIDRASFLVGDRYVYRVTPGFFEILDRKTLEPIKAQPVLAHFIVQQRTLAQWKKLELLLDDLENHKQQIDSELRRPSPADGIGWKNPHWHWGRRKAAFGETGFGQIRNGILYDPTTDKPRLLIWPAYTRNELFSAADGGGPGVGFWYPFPGRVSKFKADQLDYATREGAHHSAAELLKGMVENNQVVLKSSTLSGEVASKLVITRLQKQVGHNAPQNNRVFVSATSDVVRVGYDSRLYLIDRSQFPPPAAPFHIIPTQTAFATAPGEKITLTYKADGAQRYALRIKELSNPIALRSDSGTFAFELNPDVEAMADTFVRLVASRRLPIDQRRTSLQKAIEASQLFFEQVVGRATSGVALPIQVLVDAQRPDLKTTGLVHDVLYEVPQEIVVTALKRDHEEFEELQRKAREKREQRGGK